MKIEFPTPAEIPALRQLWKDAFADSDEFLDIFFSAAFSPRRCRCALVGGQLAGALYWFDVSCRGQSMAYLYAVATDPGFRGRGICKALMADTHEVLKNQGYVGAVLVPQGADLFQMYEKMGYRVCTAVSEFVCTAGGDPAPMHTIGPAEYARKRRELLPEGGVIQEGENLEFLQQQARFYTGLGFLLAARREGDVLTGIELLGNTAMAPGILSALGLSRGSFRSPGGGVPFGMFLPLAVDVTPPAYFGLAFD